MPRQRVTDRQFGFGGGLNTVADESQLGANDLRSAANARLTTFGAVKKRRGTQRVSAAAVGSGNTVRGGFGWVRTSGAVQELVISNGLLHTGTYGIPMTWSAQVGALSTTAVPSFATFYETAADACYIADGGALNKWDGTTFSVNLAGTPNVSQIAAHNLRLWGCGDTAQPARLYFSGLSNGDTLNGTGGGFADIRTFGQQQLTALAAVGDSLLIFHPNAISVFTGFSQDDFDVDSGTRGLSSEVGTTAPRSVVTVENVCYFVSNRGPYAASVSEGVMPIGAKVEGVFASLNQTQFGRLWAAHNRADREVLFYLPDIGIYAYNYRLRAWTGPWTGSFTSPVTHSLWETVDATSVPIVLCGATDGFVRRIDSPSIYKDDVLSDGTSGTAFTLSAKTRRFFPNDLFTEKAYRYGYVQANLHNSAGASFAWQTATGSGTQNLSIANTSLWGAVDWNDFTWGSVGSLGARVQMHESGPFCDVTLNDSGLAESEFSAVEVEAFDMTRRFG